MAGNPTPYPPPPYQDWKQHRRMMKDQARMQKQAMRQRAHLYREHMRAMRRGSILGPLVLIAIGVIFLMIQTGHIAAGRAWEWYGRWWPLLLVGAGLIVLAEWAIDQATASPDHPAGHRGISGGLWTLFVFAALFGVAAHHATTSLDWTFAPFQFGPNQTSLEDLFGERHELDEPVSYALPAGAGITLVSPHGGVNISGLSDDGQMHIQLHHVIYTNSGSPGAEIIRRQLAPEITSSGKDLTVRLPYRENTQTDVTVTLPAATPLTITADRGDVDVSGIKGAVSITANRGNVDVSAITGTVDTRIHNAGSSFTGRNITGAVTLASDGHDITLADIDGPVTVSSRAGGSTHFEHIHGAAGYHSSRTQFDAARLDGEFDINGSDLTVDAAVGPVTLTTFSYNIMLGRITGAITVDNNHGSVDLTSLPPLGNATIENHNGSVHITLPQKAAFSVQADTTNGQITTDFPLNAVDHKNHGTLNGTVGTGGAILRITTTQGDISLNKGDLQPLPPAPPAPKLSIPAPKTRASAFSHDDTLEAHEDVRQAILEARQNVQQALRESRQDIEEARRDTQQAATDARQAEGRR